MNQTLIDSLDDTKQQLQAESRRFDELHSQIANIATLLGQSGTDLPTTPDQNVQLVKYLEMRAE